MLPPQGLAARATETFAPLHRTREICERPHRHPELVQLMFQRTLSGEIEESVHEMANLATQAP
jgi:hypothetical protein